MNAKQSDAEAPVMIELCEMPNIPLFPSIPGPLWPGVVAPDKDPIYWLNRTKLFAFKLRIYAELISLK